MKTNNMYDYSVNRVVGAYKCVFISSITTTGFDRNVIDRKVMSILRHMSVKIWFPTNILIQFFNF